jgi:predicted nucleic acid-binding Zn ribbon protein
MPIYEYRRPDGTTFEIQQSFSDETLSVDPDSGVPVERVLHAPAVHFKGKGFYNTDYGTRNRQRETAAAAASSSEGEKSSSEKSSGEGKSSSGEGKSSSGESKFSSGESSSKSENGAKGNSAEAKPVVATSSPHRSGTGKGEK